VMCTVIILHTDWWWQNHCRYKPWTSGGLSWM